jgi:hypothetical protein
MKLTLVKINGNLIPIELRPYFIVTNRKIPCVHHDFLQTPFGKTANTYVGRFEDGTLVNLSQGGASIVNP